MGDPSSPAPCHQQWLVRAVGLRREQKCHTFVAYSPCLQFIDEPAVVLWVDEHLSAENLFKGAFSMEVFLTHKKS